MRLDLYLVEKGLAPSRSKAQELIRNSSVQVHRQSQNKIITQPSFEISDSDRVEVLENEILQFVSRGGLKLSGALKHTQLDVKGFRALDVGQSTGGFTDALLQAGATKVLGFDVGHGQLHSKLQNHSQVVSLEGVHIQQTSNQPEILDFVREGLDLVVVDVSFISVLSALKELVSLRELEKRGSSFKIIALIKPQFEVGKDFLNRSGVVKDPEQGKRVVGHIVKEAEGLGVVVVDSFPSEVAGGDGNQEYFLYGELV